MQRPPDNPDGSSPAEWIEHRDRQVRAWVGDDDAARWLAMLDGVFDMWDDLIDGDAALTHETINAHMCTAVLNMPLNPFYRAHSTALTALMALTINAWLDANELEKARGVTSRAQAFVLRALFVDIVLAVIGMTRGMAYLRSVSMDVRRMFASHESFDDYCAGLEEGGDAEQQTARA